MQGDRAGGPSEAASRDETNEIRCLSSEQSHATVLNVTVNTLIVYEDQLGESFGT